MKDNKQKVVEIVETVMELGGTNYSRAAALLCRNGKPLTRQSFFKMVKNGSLRLGLFLDLLDELGLGLVIRRK